MIAFERRYCVAMLVLSCIVTVGCKEKDSGAPSAVPVTIATVERRPVPFSLDAAGTVEPLERVNVEGQVSGQLRRIGFHEGDQVTKGQVLFEIDSRPFKAALDAAAAMLARDVIQAQNAQRDVQRYAALVEKEYVTSQQYDAIRAQAAALNATVMAD